MITAARRASAWTAALLALAAASSPLPAIAQESAEARLRRVEAEVRALQRRVFTEGAGAGASFQGPGLPSTTTGAVTDVLARMDAVEAQLARFTAQVEESNNRTRQLEARLAAMEAARASGLPATNSLPVMNGLPVTNGLPGTNGLPATNAPPVTGAPPSSSNIGASVPVRTPAAAATSPDRLAAVSAIARPQSDDAGEDDYLYGFRLYDAKLYPEAAQQLQATITRHPRHKRISYARNLLGRTYLDDGKPGAAAQVFLQNYQADRRGARAPDSLLYLAIAMIQLKETGRACVALQELSEGYPAEVAGRLGADYATARAAARCS